MRVVWRRCRWRVSMHARPLVNIGRSTTLPPTQALDVSIFGDFGKKGAKKGGEGEGKKKGKKGAKKGGDEEEEEAPRPSKAYVVASDDEMPEGACCATAAASGHADV